MGPRIGEQLLNGGQKFPVQIPNLERQVLGRLPFLDLASRLQRVHHTYHIQRGPNLLTKSFFQDA